MTLGEVQEITETEGKLKSSLKDVAEETRQREQIDWRITKEILIKND